MHRCVAHLPILASVLLIGCGETTNLEGLQTTNVSSIAVVSGYCSTEHTIQVDDVSIDGNVVVGMCAKKLAPEEWMGFRYSKENNMEIIEGLAGKTINELRVSGDGLVIWGSYNVKGEEPHLFRHTKLMGIQHLGTIGKPSIALGSASADGSVVVGSFLNSLSEYPLLYRSFRYSQSGGFEDLGLLNGDSTHPLGISPDGSQFVGHVDVGTSSNQAIRDISAHAFAYSKANGMRDIGVLRWGHDAFATGVSNDGAVVSGFGRFMIGFVVTFYEETYGFVRRGNEQMQQLSGIPGVPTVIRISADGTRVSGSYVDSESKRHVFTAKLALN